MLQGSIFLPEAKEIFVVRHSQQANVHNRAVCLVPVQQLSFQSDLALLVFGSECDLHSVDLIVIAAQDESVTLVLVIDYFKYKLTMDKENLLHVRYIPESVALLELVVYHIDCLREGVGDRFDPDKSRTS